MYSHNVFVLGDFDPDKKLFTEHKYTDCRDIFVHSYNRWVYDQEYNEIDQDDKPVFKQNPFDRAVFALCLGDTTPAEFDKKREKILSLLHPFEKVRHWKRTKIYTGNAITVNSSNISKDNTIALVIGSRCWVNNPFFLYIYSAVFKGFMHPLSSSEVHVQQIRNASTMQEYFNRLEEGGYYQYENASLWLDVIKDRKKLFKHFTIEDMAIRKRAADNIEPAYGYGIYELVDNGNQGRYLLSAKRNITMYEVMKRWLRKKR